MDFIQFTGPIKPLGDSKFAVVEDSYLQGGYRVINTAAELSIIDATAFKVGMLVHTLDDGKIYRCETLTLTTNEFGDPVADATFADTGLLKGPIVLGPNKQPGVIVFGGANSTYSQNNGTVTVTKTTGHGLNAEEHNGMSIFLMRGTGGFGFSNGATDLGLKYHEVCTDFTYVDANTFTCKSLNLLTSSGEIGALTDPDYNAPAISVTIPSGFLKDNSWFRTNALLTHNGSANGKLLSVIWGPDNTFENELVANVLRSSFASGNTVVNETGNEIRNQNSKTKQLFNEAVAPAGWTREATNGRPKRLSRDTNAATRLVYGVSLSSPEDWAIVEYGYIEVYR